MRAAADFIAWTASLPWCWSYVDCFCWPALFVEARVGFDPAADFHGAYDSAFGWRRIVMQAGGLEAMARRQMSGLREGGEGDGVCLARVDGRTIGGILSDGRLFLKRDRGVVSPERFAILARWEV